MLYLTLIYISCLYTLRAALGWNCPSSQLSVGSTTDASLLSSVRDKFHAHGSRLGIAVVSKITLLRKSLDTADVNVVQLCVENGTVCIIRLGPDRDVPLVCKPYLLCVIVCDEEEIKHTLQQTLGEVYSKFLQV